MGFSYEAYAGGEGIRRFGEVARNFDFGRSSPSATFPPDFVEAYVHHLDSFSDAVEDDVHFIARYPDGAVVLMFDGLDDPAHIHSVNAMISESRYAPAGAVILPPGHYSVGEAYSDTAQHMLLVDLRSDRPTYGSIHAWERSHDPLGEGDNVGGLGHIADSLGAFLDGLSAKDDLSPWLLSRLDAKGATSSGALLASAREMTRDPRYKVDRNARSR